MHHRLSSHLCIHRLRLQNQETVNRLRRILPQHRMLFLLRILFLLRHPCLLSSLLVPLKLFAVYVLKMIMTFVTNNAHIAIGKMVAPTTSVGSITSLSSAFVSLWNTSLCNSIMPHNCLSEN
jgi:hypothetical protein